MGKTIELTAADGHKLAAYVAGPDDAKAGIVVVQEAFAGLYRNWGGLRDRNAAIGYLRTAVVNGSRSMLRRRRTARAYVPPDPGTAQSPRTSARVLTTSSSATYRRTSVGCPEGPSYM